MEQIKQLLAQLSTKQKISIALAAVLAVAAVMGLSRWNKERDFKPLFTGMSAEDAGAVVQKLKEGGVEYRLSEAGDAVSIPSAKVAESRLELAAAGLPKTGRIGFELFDKTSFGTTEFVEHINYQRALEGELERSIISVAGVEQARVHITFLKDSVFLNARQPAKASVMLRLRPGGKLSPQHVQGISHLIASAVEGLAPDGVSILDMDGRLLSRPKRNGDEGELSDLVMEARQKYERDLVAKISSNLEPLLGPDGFRASASVEFDGTSAEQSEETFDPTKSVMLTSQKTEDTGTGGAGSSGIPGTASNLPRPESRPASTLAGMSRRTESITYASSRVVRKTQIPQGSVKKMSVSVLVDYVPTWTGAGAQRRRSMTAPTPEMIKSIRDLVAGATGLTPDRGDQLIVEALAFESTREADAAPPEPKPGAPQSQEQWKQLLNNKPLVIGVAAGALVLLLLVGFVARMMFKRKKAKAAAVIAQALPPAQESAQAELPEKSEEQMRLDAEALKAKYLPPANVTELTNRIRELAKVDDQISVAIVRRWMGESES